MSFKALWITEGTDGKFHQDIVERNIEELPGGDVLISVQYSSLNYKDALSATGNKGITKKYPHTPGIDAAGLVEISRCEDFVVGDEVIVTGHDLGMNTSGGFGQFIRVPGDWVSFKPKEYTLKESMIIGTAGFTAATALYKMELLGLRPSHGKVVVTGATGGVGSMAVAILAKAGYEVIAVTGKNNAAEYLRFLGAAKIENRDFVNDVSGKSLLRAKWAAAIDTVGGNTLDTLLKGCSSEGIVAATGLVSSSGLETTVFPFILNGVSLVGVGSAGMSPGMRNIIWNKLSTDWIISDKLATIGTESTLKEVINTHIHDMLEGKMMGRIVVNMQK